LSEFREKKQIPQPIDSIQLFDGVSGDLIQDISLSKPVNQPPPDYP